jgi:hypothetical protein
MGTEGRIKVTCLPWKINRYARFSLVVDNTDQGLLRRGKPQEIRLPSGSHTVQIRTAGLGILDREVQVPEDGTVNLACALSYEGLTSAARSRHTEVCDGPSPITMWPIEDGELPDEPNLERRNWWTVILLSQEAMTESPLVLARVFHRVAIKHYVAFGLVASLVLGLLLFDTLSQPNPSVLWVPLSVIVAGSLGVMVLRALARHRLPPSPVSTSNPVI